MILGLIGTKIIPYINPSYIKTEVPNCYGFEFKGAFVSLLYSLFQFAVI